MIYGSQFLKVFEGARGTVEYWVEDFRLNFSHFLSEIMRTKSVSQKDLAERLGKSEAYVSKILNSDSVNYTVKTMVQLCLALDSKITLRIEDIEPVMSGSETNMTVEEYMALPYQVTVQPLVREKYGQGGYIVWCEDLGRVSCNGWGETVPEAIKAMNDVKRRIFERCLREGFFIPLPKQWKRLSGGEV